MDMEKSTEHLLEVLQSKQDMGAYFDANETEFIHSGLSEYLNAAVEHQGLKKSDVIQRSGLDRVYAYQIFSGKRVPSRDKLLQLCVGLQYDFLQAQTLLKHFGYPMLYPRNKRDSILIRALHERSTVIELNLLLDQHGFDPLD